MRDALGGNDGKEMQKHCYFSLIINILNYLLKYQSKKLMDDLLTSKGGLASKTSF